MIVLLDQTTKIAVESHLYFRQAVELLPVFNVTRDHNPGAAFSLFASASGWQWWFFSALAVVISGVLIAWLRQVRPGAVLEPLAITCILGGALGNLLDRIRFGYVIDFIQVHWHEWYFPTFNLADAAITIGAGLLIAQSLFTHKTEHLPEHNGNGS